MTRRHRTRRIICYSVCSRQRSLPPAGSWLACVERSHAQSHAYEIESLELQYLATKAPEQRKQFVNELKALAKGSSPADAGALNASVSAMLPARTPLKQAEDLAGDRGRQS